MVFLPFTSVKFCQLLLSSLTLEIYTTYLSHFPSVLILISFFNALPHSSLLYSTPLPHSPPLPYLVLLFSSLLYSSNHLLQLFLLNFSAFISFPLRRSSLLSSSSYLLPLYISIPLSLLYSSTSFFFTLLLSLLFPCLPIDYYHCSHLKSPERQSATVGILTYFVRATRRAHFKI